MDDLKKYIYIKNVLSKDERNLLFNYAKLKNKINKSDFCKYTNLGETAIYGDPIVESLLESKKQFFEKHCNLELNESYSYWRLNKKFSSLSKHKDRPGCEITVSVNVEADCEWPLFIDGQRILINPGDGVLYFGAKQEHWREEYDGDYSLNIFFHYVNKNGKFKDFTYDTRHSLGIK